MRSLVHQCDGEETFIHRNIVERDIMMPYSDKGLKIKMLPHSNKDF